MRKFPSYSAAFDLNSTKFTARWIHPFLEKDDFCKVFNLMRADDSDPDDIIGNMYLQTAGNARHMKAMINMDSETVDSYSLCNKPVDNDNSTILKGVLSCVRDSMPDCNMYLETMANLTRYVPLASVMQLHQIQSLENCDIVKCIYNLADQGLLRFNDEFDGSHCTPAVSLGTPRIYLELSYVKCDLSAKESAAHHCPFGSLSKLAEDLAMRFIIEKADAWIPDIKPLQHCRCGQLSITNQRTNPGVKTLASITRDELLN